MSRSTTQPSAPPAPSTHADTSGELTAPPGSERLELQVRELLEVVGSARGLALTDKRFRDEVAMLVRGGRGSSGA